MCKLFCWVNQHTTLLPKFTADKVDKVLTHLFYINSYGQVDGSGIMWMEKEGASYYLKDSIPSPEFLNSKGFTELHKNMSTKRFLAGHTRYSTVGKNSPENSHPFHEGKYLGMQNGTISNNHLSLVPNKISPCEVDSQSVFWSMSKQGIEATFEAYEGAGVFLFFDVEAKTFNIVKNNKRTLHRAKLSGFNSYLFCTDAHALELVCARASLPIDKVEVVANDELTTYHSNNTTTKRPLIVKSYTPTYNHAYESWGNYGNRYAHQPKPSFTTRKVPPLLINSKKPNVYLDDCMVCASPIYSLDNFYGDSYSLASSTHLSCSCCVQEATANLGYTLYNVSAEQGVNAY